jgi:glycosyltransferase involved in cell wall biosynthesis
MEVSVIIPTYKRPKQLRRALESFANQDFARYEILVVDNEGSSEIEHLVLRLNRSLSCPLYYVSEPRLGLHNARHAGARAAKGKILVFTDDDATFDPHWLSAYEKAFLSYPNMAAAGGCVRPIWESEPPAWLNKFMRNKKIFPPLSLIDLRILCHIGDGGMFFGVNMAIRRNVLFELGGFSPEAFGDVWLGNGETGLDRKLRANVMSVGYIPQAIVYHHIPVERMTVEYLKRRMANEGACDMYTRFHHALPGTLGLWCHALSIMCINFLLWLIEPFVSGQTSWFFLQVQLQGSRTRSQLMYVRRLLFDKDFPSFVLKGDWL